MSSTPVTTPQAAKGRLAARSRYLPANDPQIAEARRDLAAAKIDAFVERALEKAPPLTDEQAERIAHRLRGGDDV